MSDINTVAVPVTSSLTLTTTAGKFARLKHFEPSEFHHPEMMNLDYLLYLDAVRDKANVRFLLTSDGRTPAENQALSTSGSTPNSTHMLGDATDFVPSSPGLDRRVVLYRVVSAVVQTPLPPGLSFELELVNSPQDFHVHLAIFRDGRESRIVVTAT